MWERRQKTEWQLWKNITSKKYHNCSKKISQVAQHSGTSGERRKKRNGNCQKNITIVVQKKYHKWHNMWHKWRLVLEAKYQYLWRGCTWFDFFQCECCCPALISPKHHRTFFPNMMGRTTVFCWKNQKKWKNEKNDQETPNVHQFFRTFNKHWRRPYLDNSAAEAPLGSSNWGTFVRAGSIISASIIFFFLYALRPAYLLFWYIGLAPMAWPVALPVAVVEGGCT